MWADLQVSVLSAYMPTVSPGSLPRKEGYCPQYMRTSAADAVVGMRTSWSSPAPGTNLQWQAGPGMPSSSFWNLPLL